MAAEYVILVHIDERFGASLESSRLEGVARRALESEGTAACELSVTVTDDETLRRLNREYADEDEVTDVLSFSQREGEEFVGPPEGVPPLGEVIISYPQAERQAPDGVELEIERLLVHGVLHLLGYDHAEAEEERTMRAREEEVLSTVSDVKRFEA